MVDCAEWQGHHSFLMSQTMPPAFRISVRTSYWEAYRSPQTSKLRPRNIGCDGDKEQMILMRVVGLAGYENTMNTMRPPDGLW